MDKNNAARKQRRQLLRKQYLHEKWPDFVLKAVMTLVLAAVVLYICRDGMLNRAAVVIVLYVLITLANEVKVYKKQWLPEQEREIAKYQNDGKNGQA